MNTNYSYIIADHIRSACFIIADGVLPSPKQRGYVLRRLIRRAFVASLKLSITVNREYITELVESVVKIYEGVYSNLSENKILIIETINLEAQKFMKARTNGEKEWKKCFSSSQPTDKESVTTFAWDLYQSHGVPFEVSEEQVDNQELLIDTQKLHSLIEEHQAKSTSVLSGQFKSGLGNDSEKTRKLHTTTHLLHAILKEIFGSTVHQIGSAITDEKARFDVTLDQTLSAEQEKAIEVKVQEAIAKKATVTHQEMSENEAREIGAIGLFGEKYPKVVTVYSIITPEGEILSQEFCGGPHVTNTDQIGSFQLLKIKSIGQGSKRFEFTVY